MARCDIFIQFISHIGPGNTCRPGVGNKQQQLLRCRPDHLVGHVIAIIVDNRESPGQTGFLDRSNPVHIHPSLRFIGQIVCGKFRLNSILFIQKHDVRTVIGRNQSPAGRILAEIQQRLLKIAGSTDHYDISRGHGDLNPLRPRGIQSRFTSIEYGKPGHSRRQSQIFKQCSGIGYDPQIAETSAMLHRIGHGDIHTQRQHHRHDRRRRPHGEPAQRTHGEIEPRQKLGHRYATCGKKHPAGSYN